MTEHSWPASLVGSDLATSCYNLGWPPEIDVDWKVNIWDPGIWPTSCDRESDMDIPAPLARAALAASPVVEEISELL